MMTFFTESDDNRHGESVEPKLVDRSSKCQNASRSHAPAAGLAPAVGDFAYQVGDNRSWKTCDFPPPPMRDWEVLPPRWEFSGRGPVPATGASWASEGPGNGLRRQL
ncbi:hypothetical protein GCM10014715_62850 [Streptomyces spiralis]|uniref:Uncharacterized protein n=1 Tax=Streptomyces spiralis TaxID=66376 RepID=A0A919DYG0_9ACTN|nr:hypothetical protein GCM10014715_62850 [Streptomyces spiralis]